MDRDSFIGVFAAKHPLVFIVVTCNLHPNPVSHLEGMEYMRQFYLKFLDCVRLEKNRILEGMEGLSPLGPGLIDFPKRSLEMTLGE